MPGYIVLAAIFCALIYPACAYAAKGECVRVWDDPDAGLHYRSNYQELSLDRKAGTITQKIAGWREPRTVRLTEQEFAALDRRVSGLCLTKVRGPLNQNRMGSDVHDFSITGASGKKTLIVSGAPFGGDGEAYEITRKDSNNLLAAIGRVAPASRDCLKLGPAIVTLSGKLPQSRPSADGQPLAEKDAVLVLDSVQCVVSDRLGDADRAKFTIGSVPLRTEGHQPVAAELAGQRVLVTGTLHRTGGGKGKGAALKVQSIKRAE